MLACAGLGKLERAFAIAKDAAARDLPVGRIAHGALVQLLCSHGDLQVSCCSIPDRVPLPAGFGPPCTWDVPASMQPVGFCR